MGEIVFPQGRTHQLFIQNQVISHDNMHANSLLKPEQVALRNIHVYTDMHVIIINEKIGHRFEREQGGGL